MVNYNRWIYDLMLPYLGNRILEFGAGIGVMTPFFLREERRVMAIDIDEQLIQCHQERIPANPQLTVSCVYIRELVAQNQYREAFDTVASSNVLEHIPDGEDQDAVIAMFSLLKPGGFAVHWVPACQCIWGSLDVSFGHERRYNRKRLQALFTQAGFQIISCQYWNMPGFVGWWLYGYRRAKALPRFFTLVYDRFIVPFIRVIEPRLWRPFGQSLLIIAQKPDLTCGRLDNKGAFRENYFLLRDQVGLLENQKATDHLALSEGLENPVLGAIQGRKENESYSGVA